MEKENNYLLDMNNPRVKRDLDESVRRAEEFSQKFYNARIIPYEVLIQPMTI